MTEEEKFKKLEPSKSHKLRNLIIGLAGTVAMGGAIGGFFKYKQVKEDEKKAQTEAIKKEWKDFHSDADSTLVKPDLFYAKKNSDTVAIDTLNKQYQLLKTARQKYIDLADILQQKHNKELLMAAKNADAKAIEKALTQGANINTVDKNGKTAVMLTLDNSSAARSFSATRTLIKHGGFDINQKDNDGITVADRAQAKAQGDDARFISLDRELKSVNKENTNASSIILSDKERFNLDSCLAEKIDLTNLHAIKHHIKLYDQKLYDIAEDIKKHLGYEVTATNDGISQKVDNLVDGKIETEEHPAEESRYRQRVLFREIELGRNLEQVKGVAENNIEQKEEAKKGHLIFGSIFDLYNKIKGNVK